MRVRLFVNPYFPAGPFTGERQEIFVFINAQMGFFLQTVELKNHKVNSG